jgi:hypothetical protein
MKIENQTERLVHELPVRQRPETLTAWQQWLQHPERFWVRQALFQIHLWVGVGVGLYVVLMSENSPKASVVRLPGEVRQLRLHLLFVEKWMQFGHCGQASRKRFRHRREIRI